MSIKLNIDFISSIDLILSVTITNEGLLDEALIRPQEPFSKINLTPLIVRISDDAPTCVALQIVSIFDIDPSRVINERDSREKSYYMNRIETLDIVKVV